MSDLTTLARPYARAAFDLAQRRDDLAGWGSALDIAAQVVSDERVAEWLGSPDLDHALAVETIAGVLGESTDPRLRRFLEVLAANDRLPLLPEISAGFERLRAAAENRLRVRVVSAIELDADQAERLKSALARRFERDIELRNEVDAGLLGGAVIYAGDEVIDGSVRGRLARLQNSLA